MGSQALDGLSYGGAGIRPGKRVPGDVLGAEAPISAGVSDSASGRKDLALCGELHPVAPVNELSDRVGLARRVLSEMITVKAGPRRAGELAARRHRQASARRLHYARLA